VHRIILGKSTKNSSIAATGGNAAATGGTLSVCMIVKNESALLARCLESIHPVADQIVVVDTGSSDDTVAIARSFGADVVTTDWRNDFAWARNISLDHANGGWVLWLDADDVVPEESLPKLRMLKKNAPDRVYGLIVRNERPGNTGSEFVQARMFPNRNDIRFEGAIHEQMMPCALRLGLSMEKRDVVIEHHGYADPEKLKSKALRNIELLLAKYPAESCDPVTAVEIADSYRLISDVNEARKWYDVVLAVPRCAEETPVIASQAHMGIGSIFNESGEYEKAIPHFKASLQLAPWRTDALYLLAVCYDRAGAPDEAIDCLRRILAASPAPGQVSVDFRAVRLKAVQRLLRLLTEQKRTGEASAETQAAMTAFPDRPEVFLMAGKVLLSQGRLIEALQAFEKSVTLAERKNIDSYIGLCFIYRKADRRETASKSFDSVKQLFDHQARYWAFRRFVFEEKEAPVGFTLTELEKEWWLIKREFFMGEKETGH
jgi:tetratricopeptide (TPR) repeat protein